MRKFLKGCLFLQLILSFVVVLYINWSIYKPYPEDHSVELIEQSLAQLTYLENNMHDGLADEMQGEYPEGYIFTNALYGLSWVELCRQSLDESLKFKCLQEANWALHQINSDKGREIFEQNLNPPYGVFYHSWKTYLLGMILSIQDSINVDSVQLAEFKGDCEVIRNSYLTDATPYPQSYDELAWPADAMPGIAALRLSDKISGTEYDSYILEWMNEVKIRLTGESALVPHSVKVSDGIELESARGASQALILRFLYDIDPGFGMRQYRIFRQKYTIWRFGFPCIREYAVNDTGSGDIDSGPIVFDVGPAATIVASGTARWYGDTDLASGLYSSIEMGGMPLHLGDERYYLFGKMPIGDIFIVWSRLSLPIDKQCTMSEVDDLYYEYWRVIILLISILLVTLNLILFRKRIHRK